MSIKIEIAVLLDDDPLILKSWALMAREAGVEFYSFSESSELLDFLPGLSKAAMIYLDSQLKGGERGEDVAKKIYDLGFRHLYLATGYPAEKFAHCTWLEGVVGKDPPF